MAQHNPYAKYQVYFFLYLAVICELLIIIVERDDAEAGWLQEKASMEYLTRRMVIELMKNNPVTTVTGATVMRQGEERDFTFGVQGLGTMDNVVGGPSIQVLHNGAVASTLAYPRDIREVQQTGGDSVHTYRFTWRAPAPGSYEFRGMTQTNRVSFQRDSLKVGPLMLPIERIREILGYVPAVDGTLSSSMAVTVISTAEQLTLSIPRTIVTAAGFPTTMPVHVEGTDPARTRAVADHGSVANAGNALVWNGAFPSAGTYSVTIHATDSRGEGGKSVDSKTATAVAMEPVLRKPLPAQLYPQETAEIDIAVAGLENAGDYSWTLAENGREIARGTHPRISVTPASTGRIEIGARYLDRVYPVAGGGSSTFTIPVVDPPYRIFSMTFARNGEYPVTHRFQFRAARYGRSRSQHSVAVQPAEIRVEAVDEDGNDLLARDPDIAVAGDATIVTFQLRGRIAADGTGATVILRVGDRQETIPVVLTPE
jgi:hypothetical protein